MKRHSVLAISAALCIAVLIAACGDDDTTGPPPAPTVTSVAPTQGPTTGGTAITITGTNFTTGATVTVGASPATNVVVVSANTITCTTPAGSAGPVAVSVTTTGGTATLPSAFTYVTPAPTLTSVAPTQGSTTGGTAITLTGTNFIAGATVTVGGNPATNVVVVDATTITCTTPAGAAGPADVSVTTSGGTATLPAAFTYIIPAPTLTSVAPTEGLITGGTAITLTGTEFIAGATVTVGGNPATNVVVVDATTITCTTPAGAVGPADVSVTTAGGTATLPGGFTYINPPPTITNVAPDVGAVSGGMHHTITGTGFVANAAGPNTVTVGGNPCMNIVTVDDATITCDSPPAAAAGATTLEVTNNNGTASTAFTYFDPIWAAEGGGCAPASCTFFVIDPASGSSYTIGPIGFGVTGMFYVSGVLWGTTSGPGGPFYLITIDPMTGVGTLIGPTNDAGGTNYPFRDVTFDFNTAWPYGTDPCNLRTFNSVGLVNPPIAPVPNCAPGGGIAQDAAFANIYFMMLNNGPLYTVNVITGVFTPGPVLSGGVFPAGTGRFGGAGFHNGTLYAVEMDGTGGNRQLHSVNTATAVLTPVGPPLPSWTSAIVSPTR